MDLFNIAANYASFGNHRTGSESQLATEDWLTACLGPLADSVERFSFGYLHYHATTEVAVDGRVVPSMPLYYEATGKINNSNNLGIGIVKTNDEERAYAEILSLAKQAKNKNQDAIVIATDCDNHSLYAFNVSPKLRDSIPVVLVPGSEYEGLNRENLFLNYSAETSQRNANNIIARFGTASNQAPLVITTPISGWFECAGERGTGVALAIALANRLSKYCSVELVLASGHELGYLGGFEYTATQNQPPAAVIHLGSCLATIDAELQAWSNVEADLFDNLYQILGQQKIPLNKVGIPGKRSDWVGEAECWAHFNCPMLSIAGGNPLFHTTEDRIQVATNEACLEQTFNLLCELATLVSRAYAAYAA